MTDADAFAAVAREALRTCHFDPSTGDEDPDWHLRCGLACYDCLLSYKNQRYHRLLNRHVVKDFLVRLATSHGAPVTGGRSYDDHYQWLVQRIYPASSLEREFVDYLYQQGLRLPDSAQTRPEDDLPVQPDFSYKRQNLNGICVFIDGPSHDDPQQRAHDRSLRDSLEDRGYRVVVVRYDRPIGEQVVQYPEVFGQS